jgi:hypothetical protein
MMLYVVIHEFNFRNLKMQLSYRSLTLVYILLNNIMIKLQNWVLKTTLKCKTSDARHAYSNLSSLDKYFSTWQC